MGFMFINNVYKDRCSFGVTFQSGSVNNRGSLHVFSDHHWFRNFNEKFCVSRPDNSYLKLLCKWREWSESDVRSISQYYRINLSSS